MRHKTKGLAIASVLAVLLLLSVLPAKDTASGSRSLAERIADETAEFLKARVTLPYDSIDVDVTVPAIATRSSDVVHFDVDLFGTTRSVIGTVPVKITVMLESGETIPYTATARVRIWSKVAVAGRRLKRHETVAEDDIRFEKREVTQAFDGYFVAPEDVVGNRTTRLISSGGLFMMSSVEPVPLVTRGSDVRLTIVIGAVAITSRGKALEDGDLGSLIDVRDSATGKRLTGEVAGENVILLEVSRL